jgi:uncharacterized RDD family membrane protein YckC
MATYHAHEIQRMIDLDGVELSSFIRRAAAFFLDLAAAAVLFIPVASLIEMFLLKAGLMNENTEIIFALNLNWYSIAWTVLYYGLATYIGNGKTPGKWVLGIRVISLVHKRITLWHSVERALGYGASLLEFGFGFIQYFIHPNKRTLHDRIGETIVVREIKHK